MLDPPGLLADEHLCDRGFFVELEHEEGGRGPVLALPWRLNPGPNPTYTPAPSLGADNDYVYGDLLGLGPADIQTLIDEKIIY